MTSLAKTVHLQADKAAEQKTIFGFWVYLMTDCILFATLFATYAVLHDRTFGGPDLAEIFNAPFVLTETLLLLVSSYTCGLALLAATRNDTVRTLRWLTITFALGLTFLGMELYEFNHLVSEGFGPDRSAFLSAFFTLIGTHGLHISVGLLWSVFLFIQVRTIGLQRNVRRRLKLWSLFWHFLDIVWIFIFTMVYLLGASS